MAATVFHLRSDEWSSVQIASVVSPGLTAGGFFKTENMIAIAPEAAITGAKGVGIYKAKKIYVPKAAATGKDLAVGDLVYLDLTNQCVEKAATTGFYPIGICTEAATWDATGVEIELDGIHGAAIAVS